MNLEKTMGLLALMASLVACTEENDLAIKVDGAQNGDSAADAALLDGARPDGAPGDGARPDADTDGEAPDARVGDAQLDGAADDGVVADAAVLDGAPPPDAAVDAALDADVDAAVDAALDAALPCAEGEDYPCDDNPCGARVCVDGVLSACVLPPERCNGQDDDCDDLVDEDFSALGERCEVGQGQCAASAQFICSGDGLGLLCATTPGIPEAERCDGADNDCDGEVDEGIPAASCYDGPAGTEGVGLCHAGLSACGDAACQGEQRPEAESCNGQDDDCDGQVDEGPRGEALTAPCYTGPAETEGVGLCQAGVLTCVDGGFGECQEERLPALEICDGQDNDCDGTIDEDLSCSCVPGTHQACYSGAPETQGVGRCRAGSQLCDADGLGFGECLDERLPVAEQCNGQDDDCDGYVDEQVLGVGRACVVGVGACVNRGVMVCDVQAGNLRCNVNPLPATEETCDGVDNDCDGTIDDGLGLGERCVEGLGACEAVGVRMCQDGQVACTARPGPASPELCDGIDNDCDGASDEGLGVGEACAAGVGACVRSGAKVCGPGGDVICDAVAGPSEPESCDGLDNDCDGQTDEDNPGGGQACQTGRPGVCASGVRVCRQGALTCDGLTAPSAEVCDGLDSDCDGLIDEGPTGAALTAACYEGPAGTEGVGQCRTGLKTCAQGRFGACADQRLPSVERCDAVDNDCNGAVDDLAQGACVCEPGAVQSCYSGPAGTDGVGVCHSGLQLCFDDGQGFGGCEGEALPALERCDGVDNDCDGTIDDVPGVGVACQVGVGACARQGVERCDPATGALTCSATPGAPSAERCDGQDNDCDGQVDDVVGVGDRCTSGLGICARSGNQICDVARNALVCDATPGAPSAELCDLLDNDCDGVVDDSPAQVGEACQVGVGECLRQGQSICVAGVLGCSAQAGTPSPELCDGLDNDCDTRIDDSPTDVGVRCSEGQGSCRRDGQTLCTAGVLSCSARPGAPDVERCDDVDNDCDGVTDEDPVCLVYRSCLDAWAHGWRESGVLRVASAVTSSPVSVYCDQTTDGGGWTLVGSSKNQTFNDQSSQYYQDLMRLNPTNGHPGIYSGLRALQSAAYDVRVACRAQVGQFQDPMTVDLTFYATPWYMEWTTGLDRSSCFSENDGQGQDQPEPARRNNLSLEYLPLGTAWASADGDDFLEGEDSCDDTDDFTLDFADRGMDGDEADGTDWGEDDGDFKCGGLVEGGQWFVFARETIPYRPIGTFEIGDGPQAEDAAALSCVQACAQVFGGDPAEYACSSVAANLDRLGYLDGVEDTDFCAAPIEDTFVHPAEGAPYTCDDAGCAYSAYVSDHAECAAVQNTCWRRPVFVPPVVGARGDDGVNEGDSWTVCRADDETAWLAADGTGLYDAIVACGSLGYTQVDRWGQDCGTVCGYCGREGTEYYDWLGGVSPRALEGQVTWRCRR